ncbi:hypothetical protein Dimus_033014 [Dionaea muscipula]
MGSRTQSHQLSNGLYVSGRPEPSKFERIPTMASRAVPYTGGDIKKSGELGKMLNVPGADSSFTSSNAAKPTSSSSQPNSGSVRSGPNSGQQHPKPNSNSGSMSKKSSGSIPLPPTGLITSGPLGTSSPLGSTRRSGQLDGSAHLVSTKPAYGSAVTSITEGVKYGLRVPKWVMSVFVIVILMGLVVGAFMMVTVKKPVILVVFAAVIVLAAVAVAWNYAWWKRGLLEFINNHPDTVLREAAHDQYVKVSGIVTCGSIPLESSFQRVPRCVYVSTELHEYKGWGGKSANPRHRFFTWGCRYSEKYVADFYVSDRNTGLRALVKAGSGSKVATFVKPATVVDITMENKDLSPNFLRWLGDRNLSSDDRVMRLKEGYIKEGNVVTVMGMLRRHDNLLMIVPPTEPIRTTFQWKRCLLPMYVQGLVLTCDEDQNAEVIPV